MPTRPRKAAAPKTTVKPETVAPAPETAPQTKNAPQSQTAPASTPAVPQTEVPAEPVQETPMPDNTVDVLDFATEATANTSAAQSGPDTTQNDGTNGTDSNQDPNASNQDPNATVTPKDPKKVYPNVFASYKASDLPEGEQPNGALTVKQFAARLTAENFKAIDLSDPNLSPNATTDAFVDPQNVYTWLRAVRGPAPVVLVFPVSTEKDAEGNDVEVVSDDEREATVYLPWVEASESFKARPVRGSGGNSTAGGSKKSQDELLEDAAKKLADLTSAQDQLAQKLKKVERLSTQYDKYKDLVARKFGITEDEAHAKTEEKVKEMTAAAEAAEENAAGTETTQSA